MADLRPEHKRSFEFLLGMDKNSVSDFNDRSLREFLLDYGVDIDLDKYCVNGISMVSRLRILLKIEPNRVAIEVMCVLLAHSQASLRRSMSGCLQIGEERRGEMERRIGEIEKLISDLEKTLPDQKVKVKIYTDTGADISYLKDFFRNCDFCTFPYDSSHRRKKAPKPILARPSKAQWRDLIPIAKNKFINWPMIWSTGFSPDLGYQQKHSRHHSKHP